MTRLEVSNVSVRFGGHMALKDVSLAVEPGHITGLIGPNGAGKTTLFNVITGLQEPVRGKVVLGDRDITGWAPHQRGRQGVARTFQRLELFGSLTAYENLQVAAEIKRPVGDSNRISAADRVEGAVELIGMQPFIDKRADVLTTGQARLVELGRALVTRPEVLLLDEPASGLDADETEYFGKILQGLTKRGMAVLLVEHDVPLVMKLCQQVHVLDFGEVIASGTPATVQSDPRVIEAYLGAPAVTP